MSSESSVWVQDRTWEEVDRHVAEDQVLILPFGATEQHGPAGVVGTDTYVAASLAEDVASRTAALCAPPVWYGDSSHHSAYAGTFYLRTSTLTAVVEDICASAIEQGFTRLVLINGHRGANMPALVTACRKLHETRYPGVIFAIADPMQLSRTIANRIKSAPEHHAGELELSEMYYRYPNHVRIDRLTEASVDFDDVYGGFVGADLYGPPLDSVEIIYNSTEERAFAPTGSFVSSLGVSTRVGEQYHEHMVGRLVELVDWLRTTTGVIGSTPALTDAVVAPPV